MIDSDRARLSLKDVADYLQIPVKEGSGVVPLVAMRAFRGDSRTIPNSMFGDFIAYVEQFSRQHPRINVTYDRETHAGFGSPYKPNIVEALMCVIARRNGADVLFESNSLNSGQVEITPYPLGSNRLRGFSTIREDDKTRVLYFGSTGKDNTWPSINLEQAVVLRDAGTYDSARLARVALTYGSHPFVAAEYGFGHEEERGHRIILLSNSPKHSVGDVMLFGNQG